MRGADPNRKLTRSARATASATIAALLVALVVAACGGGSSSSSTTSTTATHGGTKTGHKTHTPPPLQQLRVVKKGSPPAGTSATAKPGDPVAILVRVPAADATKQLTVAIDRTADTTFTVTSEVAGTPLKATSQITESSGGAEILGVRYACRLQPLTFCPLQVTSSSSTHVKLKIPNPKIPVSLVVQLGAPGSIRAPQLVALGPPAPGSSVSAKVLVTATPKTKGTKPPPLGTSVSITPGSVIRVRVTVAPGAPAHATLPIKIPHTSGHSITIEAGGSSGSPSGTATVTSSSGNIRVKNVVWQCQLPPATFCPFTSVHTTATGLDFSVPTPRVPVALSLLTTAG